LLRIKPSERLGNSGGAEEILGHPWFSTLNPEKMLNKQEPVPFKPNLSSDPLDLNNFKKRVIVDGVEETLLP